MAAYYNENDKFAAAWLRELITAGLICDGEVDERDIQDVRPDDLRGFIQCHFFAGIGGWSYALRLAGWPDERAVWTGSCPCQPFSSAGRGAGGSDPRHLWPTWVRLIRECRPVVIFGEQVASIDGLAWFDTVSTDLEGADYAIAAVDCCAASVGAPHARQRLWFVADAATQRLSGQRISVHQRRSSQHHAPALWHGQAYELGNADGARHALGVEHERDDAATPVASAGKAAQQAGYWDSVEWLPCLDGKTRPTQSGLQPLADGVPARVGRLRGYGNAIVPQVAQVFIEAYMTISDSIQEARMDDETRRQAASTDRDDTTQDVQDPPASNPPGDGDSGDEKALEGTEETSSTTE